MVARFIPGNLSLKLVALACVVGALTAHTATPLEDGDAALKKYEALQGDLSQNAGGPSDPADTQAANAAMAAAEALAEAESAFRLAFKKDVSEESALGLVKVLRLKGDDDLAAEVAGKALDKGIESAVLSREYGACLLRIGPQHTQEGIDALYQSLDWDSTSADAVATWNELGGYYLRESMSVAAKNSFEAALKLDEGDVRARLGRLVVSVYDGDVADAGARLAAIGKDAQPYDAELRGRLRVALADFDAHRRVFSDTPENHFAYARLLYSAARVPQAILAAERAAKLAKTNIEMWNFLAAIQIQMGDLPSAVSSYEASLKADGNQPMVAETLQQLREATKPKEKPAPLSGQGMLR